MAIKDYNTDPDLNVQISGINIAEGCPPSGINNAIRQLMADVKAEQDVRGEEWAAQAAKDAAQDAAIADKLDTGGGTMTGHITRTDWLGMCRDTDAAQLNIIGGYNPERCAHLALYGADNPDLPGVAALTARDGTNVAYLNLYPNGAASLSGSAVLTSAGGVINFVHLPGSSGLKGEFGAVGTDWYCETSLGYTQEVPGAKLLLRRGDSTAYGQNGMAGLVAKHADGRTNYFLVLPDGKALLNDSPVLTLVDSWSDGNSYYRKYSDGWIEQGGHLDISHSTTSQTKNLHTPFSNTYYNLLLAANGNARFNDNVNIVSKTTTTFSVASGTESSGGNAPVGFDWYASGY